MEEAVSQRRKSFVATRESDEIFRLTSLLADMPRLSSPKLRLKHGR